MMPFLLHKIGTYVKMLTNLTCMHIAYIGKTERCYS